MVNGELKIEKFRRRENGWEFATMVEERHALSLIKL